MHTDGRSLAKSERQRLIASLVARSRIGTQHELVTALARAGCRVTQATISRDIRDLRLEKARDALGHTRFVLPRRGQRSNPGDALRAILARFAHRSVAAGNIVVIHSELGSAPSIGRALDELGHRKIVGTLAGDDTCLAIARTASDARDVARELQGFIGAPASE